MGIDTIAPYSVNWLATGLGEMPLKTIATDNEGNNAESLILVSISDQALVASLASPSSGTTVSLGKAFNLSAASSSLNSSIQKVDFLVNGSVVATDTTAPYADNWTAGSAGGYTVTSLVTDAQGKVIPTKLYPNFGGVMTWSINWDQHDGFNFSGPVGNKLNTMNGQ